MRAAILSARAFFREHSGYSYGPAETPAQGRARCAARMASAERWARDRGYTWEWSVDPISTSADWCDDDPPWQQWQCYLRDPKGQIVASLHGIDFGRDGEPWSDPYRRVVEAELAQEAQS